MPRRVPPSTSTLARDGRIVPWLAAEGPLSYSPEAPPERDYFFQYNRVLPGIFPDGANLRRQRYFGAQLKTDARHALRFWQLAREGTVEHVTLVMGTVAESSITAPLAVYLMDAGPMSWRGSAHVYVFIQHGSLQLISTDDQPELEASMLTLYRGVQEAKTFRHLRIDRTSEKHLATWQRYAALQAHVLSDSVRSFNSIHDRTKRCETNHIRDQSWVTDDIARDHGLDIDGEGFDAALWSTTHQSFALERWVAENKFGPHFVVGRTPLGNVRLSTFFAGEHEVRIIDPGQLEIVERHGCDVELRDV